MHGIISRSQKGSQGERKNSISLEDTAAISALLSSEENNIDIIANGGVRRNFDEVTRNKHLKSYVVLPPSPPDNESMVIRVRSTTKQKILAQHYSNYSRRCSPRIEKEISSSNFGTAVSIPVPPADDFKTTRAQKNSYNNGGSGSKASPTTVANGGGGIHQLLEAAEQAYDESNGLSLENPKGVSRITPTSNNFPGTSLLPTRKDAQKEMLVSSSPLSPHTTNKKCSQDSFPVVSEQLLHSVIMAIQKSLNECCARSSRDGVHNKNIGSTSTVGANLSPKTPTKGSGSGRLRVTRALTRRKVVGNNERFYHCGSCTMYENNNGCFPWMRDDKTKSSGYHILYRNRCSRNGSKRSLSEITAAGFESGSRSPRKSSTGCGNDNDEWCIWSSNDSSSQFFQWRVTLQNSIASRGMEHNNSISDVDSLLVAELSPFTDTHNKSNVDTDYWYNNSQQTVPPPPDEHVVLFFLQIAELSHLFSQILYSFDNSNISCIENQTRKANSEGENYCSPPTVEIKCPTTNEKKDHHQAISDHQAISEPSLSDEYCASSSNSASTAGKSHDVVVVKAAPIIDVVETNQKDNTTALLSCSESLDSYHTHGNGSIDQILSSSTLSFSAVLPSASSEDNNKDTKQQQQRRRKRPRIERIMKLWSGEEIDITPILVEAVTAANAALSSPCSLSFHQKNEDDVMGDILKKLSNVKHCTRIALSLLDKEIAEEEEENNKSVMTAEEKVLSWLLFPFLRKQKIRKNSNGSDKHFNSLYKDSNIVRCHRPSSSLVHENLPALFETSAATDSCFEGRCLEQQTPSASSLLFVNQYFCNIFANSLLAQEKSFDDKRDIVNGQFKCSSTVKANNSRDFTSSSHSPVAKVSNHRVPTTSSRSPTAKISSPKISTSSSRSPTAKVSNPRVSTSSLRSHSPATKTSSKKGSGSPSLPNKNRPSKPWKTDPLIGRYIHVMVGMNASNTAEYLIVDVISRGWIVYRHPTLGKFNTRFFLAVLLNKDTDKLLTNDEKEYIESLKWWGRTLKRGSARIKRKIEDMSAPMTLDCKEECVSLHHHSIVTKDQNVQLAVTLDYKDEYLSLHHHSTILKTQNMLPENSTTTVPMKPILPSILPPSVPSNGSTNSIIGHSIKIMRGAGVSDSVSYPVLNEENGWIVYSHPTKGDNQKVRYCNCILSDKESLSDKALAVAKRQTWFDSPLRNSSDRSSLINCLVKVIVGPYKSKTDICSIEELGGGARIYCRNTKTNEVLSTRTFCCVLMDEQKLPRKARNYATTVKWWNTIKKNSSPISELKRTNTADHTSNGVQDMHVVEDVMLDVASSKSRPNSDSAASYTAISVQEKKLKKEYNKSQTLFQILGDFVSDDVNLEQNPIDEHFGRGKRQIKLTQRYVASDEHGPPDLSKVGMGFNCPRCNFLCEYTSQKCDDCGLTCRYAAGQGVVVYSSDRKSIGGSLGDNIESFKRDNLNERLNSGKEKSSTDTTRKGKSTLAAGLKLNSVDIDQSPYYDSCEDDLPLVELLRKQSKQKRKRDAIERNGGNYSHGKSGVKSPSLSHTEEMALVELKHCVEEKEAAESNLAAQELYIKKKWYDMNDNVIQRHDVNEKALEENCLAECKIFQRTARERQMNVDSERIESERHRTDALNKFLIYNYENRNKKTKTLEIKEHNNFINRSIRYCPRMKPTKQCEMKDLCSLCNFDYARVVITTDELKMAGNDVHNVVPVGNVYEKIELPLSKTLPSDHWAQCLENERNYKRDNSKEKEKYKEQRSLRTRNMASRKSIFDDMEMWRDLCSLKNNACFWESYKRGLLPQVKDKGKASKERHILPKSSLIFSQLFSS